MPVEKNSIISKIVAEDVSLDENFASETLDISFVKTFSFDIAYGAGATGEFFVQATNVPDAGDDDWVTVPFFDETGTAGDMAISGTAGKFMANGDGAGYSFLRVIYVADSGEGEATIIYTGKAS